MIHRVSLPVLRTTVESASENDDDPLEILPKPATPKWLLLMKNKTFLLGAFLTLSWMIVAIIATWISPTDPYSITVPFAEPVSIIDDSYTAWLGTDHLGRDILSRLLYGARTVLFWGILAMSTSYALGITVGLISGYYGGWVDRTCTFLTNFMLSFPVILVYIIILLAFDGSGLNIVIAVVFTNTPLTFRLVRSLTLDIRTRDFISASIIRGESNIYILVFEILPNTLGPIIVDACLRLGYITITIGILGFLGIGLPPPTPDWGGMVQEGLPYAAAFSHVILFPCIAISSLVLGFNFVADGLQEITRR